MTRISVLIVTWEPAEELAACVRSLAAARLLAAENVGCELIVVDNGSSTFHADPLLAAWPDAMVYRNHENRGFGPAVNQAAAASSGDILLLLNPDTTAEGDALTPLASAFVDHPVVAAIAPRLLDPPSSTGESQDTFQLRRLPGLGQAARELLLLDKLRPGSAALARERYADRNRAASFQVEQPAAAALAIRRSAWDRVGGFDEAFVPAWFEDVDLCARLAEVGPILYLPSSRFIHRGGVAATRLGYRRFLPIYYRNGYRYWRKHGGRFAAMAYRALVGVGMALRLIALPVRPVVPRSRREAALAYLLTLRGAAGLDRTFAIPAAHLARWKARR